MPQSMIRFAVVGTNWITRQFVDAAHESGKYKLNAVYSRSLEQAQAFASDYPVEHLFTSLEEMAASDAIDAVYIASPNSFHAEQSMLFLRHKKHVICEKPWRLICVKRKLPSPVPVKTRLCYLKLLKPPACQTLLPCNRPCLK